MKRTLPVFVSFSKESDRPLYDLNIFGDSTFLSNELTVSDSHNSNTLDLTNFLKFRNIYWLTPQTKVTGGQKNR